jgi:hypothetical protein
MRGDGFDGDVVGLIDATAPVPARHHDAAPRPHASEVHGPLIATNLRRSAPFKRSDPSVHVGRNLHLACVAANR